jgi:RNA polymerase sigma factor (sigma-70 family)
MPNPFPHIQGACAVPGSTTVRHPGADDRELVTLIFAARAGDQIAWTSLVRRFQHPLRDIARSYRLPPTDVDDVIQTSWLNLIQDIQHLRQPAAVAGWLATTTRRNAMRLRQSHAREELTDDPELGDRTDPNSAEVDILAAERREILGRAVATLPKRHGRLMRVLIAWPTLDYREVSELLSMPVGSIGPIRARSLNRLSRDPELRTIRQGATSALS